MQITGVKVIYRFTNYEKLLCIGDGKAFYCGGEVCPENNNFP